MRLFSGEREQEGRTCPHCGAPLAAEQDWCGQCGERVGGGPRLPASWFSAGLLTALSVTLVSGAAAAGIVALTQSPTKEPPHRLLVVKKVPLVAGEPSGPGAPETISPSSEGPEPREEEAAVGERASSSSSTHTTAATSRSTAATGTATGVSGSTTAPSTEPVQPHVQEPLELQGYMLANYNPGGHYPSEALSNPRQAFEEGSQILWKVTVSPGGAQRLGVGLVIDLGKPQRVAAVELRTPTPGFGAELLGAEAPPLPPNRSSNRWLELAKVKRVGEKVTVNLAKAGHPFRYILLWLTTVPKSLAGTRSRPGTVRLEEIALFPPA